MFCNLSLKMKIENWKKLSIDLFYVLPPFCAQTRKINIETDEKEINFLHLCADGNSWNFSQKCFGGEKVHRFILTRTFAPWWRWCWCKVTVWQQFRLFTCRECCTKIIDFLFAWIFSLAKISLKLHRQHIQQHNKVSLTSPFFSLSSFLASFTASVELIILTETVTHLLPYKATINRAFDSPQAEPTFVYVCEWICLQTYFTIRILKSKKKLIKFLRIHHKDVDVSARFIKESSTKEIFLAQNFLSQNLSSILLQEIVLPETW